MTVTSTTPTTPTGVLVTTAEPETPEWFAARREGITGTDLPRILGQSRYGNALTVWQDKRGELADDAGEAARWGQLLEDVVAREWAARNDRTVARVGVLAHVDQPWMRVSLDRLVTGCDDPCGLEVKTRSAYVEGRFRADVPDDVLAQVAWGRRVAGLHHLHVAVLIGGQSLRTFRYDRDDQLEDYLVRAAEPVWQAVLDGVPPPVHPDSDGILLALLNRLYSRREGERDVDPGEARKWLDQYADASDLERRAKRLKTEAKTGLVALLDDGDTAVVDGAVAYTYRKPEPSMAMTADDVKALADDQPDLYAALYADGYIHPNDPAPRFNLTRSKE